MPEAAPVAADAEAEFGERSGIAVMLDMHGQFGKRTCQPRLERDVMPARQMRRIEQLALANAQRPSDGDAQRHDAPSAALRCRRPPPDQFHDLGKNRIERLLRPGWNLLSLQNLPRERSLHTGDFRAADVESDDGVRPAGVHEDSCADSCCCTTRLL